MNIKLVLKRFLLIILLFIISVSVTGCKKQNKNSSDFDKLMDQLFLEQLNDPMNLNFFIKDPVALGIEDLEVTPIDMSYQSFLDYNDYLSELKKEIESFSITNLTNDQQLTYQVVLEYINNQLKGKEFYYFDRPLGSYLGYQAELPIILSEYHFYRVEDIENYLDYLSTTKKTFENIIAFENEKLAKGMGMPEAMINGIIDQINSFVNMEENYLIDTFNTKIDEVTFLTYSEKVNYKSINEDKINNEFVPAFVYLKDEVTKLLGKGVNDKGLSYYTNGKDYYQYLFNQATGTNMSVNKGYLYLEDKLNEGFSKLLSIFQNNPEYGELIFSEIVPQMEYNQILQIFLNNYKEDFIEIEDVDIRIESIPKALEEFSSPAMYFVSPLDAKTNEVIYVNNTLFSSDPTYAAVTLSHEGVPGHLLQHVTLKNSNLPNIRKMLDFPSYTEGWATYVQTYSSKYYDVEQGLFEAYHLNNSLTYLIYCIADIGINYRGWTINQLSDFLSDYFGELNQTDLNDIYYQLIEIPTNFLEYYFSYYQILDIKEEFIVQAKPYNFSNPDYEFHKFYLEMGPSSFTIMEDYIDDYLEK